MFKNQLIKAIESSKQDFEKSYNFIKVLKSNPVLPIVIYGVKPFVLNYWFRILLRQGLKVVAIADKYKHGQVFQETNSKIISPQEILKYEECFVFVVPENYFNEIKQELVVLGIAEDKIIMPPPPWMVLAQDKLYSHADFIKQYGEQYEIIYDFFKDEISKQIVVDRAKLYITGLPLHKTTPLSFEQSCFDFNFEYNRREIFVQAGCCNGSTVKEFIKFRQNNPHDIIYSFEADPQCYNECCDILKQYSNVEVVPFGLNDKHEKLFIAHNSNGGSYIVNKPETGKNILSTELITLDSFFENKEFPTFIQFDIEGFEQQALNGARKIIKENKPKLAICIYHKIEDIYEIPKLILGINPGYSEFWLHHCSEGNIYETVLFVQ